MHDPALCLSGFIDSSPHRMGLALAIASIGLLVIGTGLASYFLEDKVRSEASAQARHSSTHDGLTGLLSRARFITSANEAMAGGKGGFAVITVNIDRFRDINDQRGQAVGDEVLRAIARRLRQALGPENLLARLGGDEFAVLAPLADEENLPTLVRRLMGTLTLPVQAGEKQVPVAASLGVATSTDAEYDIEVLLGNANLALERAKDSVSEQVCYYDAAMDERVRERRLLALDLAHGLERGEFFLLYQVQHSINEGHIVGYEALIRWAHPKRGIVAPLDFISLAEETGLIVPLGEWVLRTACAAAQAWPGPYRVAINVSPVQLQDDEFPRRLERILTESGLDPSRLDIEVTESTLMADPARTVRLLQSIRALGASISMDDFGTGYSSLASLSLFSFDRIKLDKSFIAQIELNPMAEAIVRAVLSMGRSLKIPVLAEGIEREDQLAFLAAQGCSEAQGYFFGRPGTSIQAPPLIQPRRIRKAITG
jgi:diguanylate cyclase (GGDEF)-like protein